jgi:hypothetical protein
VYTHDTLRLSAAGYMINDSVTAFIGGRNLESHLVIDQYGRLAGFCILPDMESGNYQIATHAASDWSEKSQSFPYRRGYDFECEDMSFDLRNQHGSFHSMCDLMGVRCGNHAAFVDTLDDTIRLQFLIPQRDTFSVTAWMFRGRNFGTYDLSVDGHHAVAFNGFDTNDIFGPDTIALGTTVLDSGSHTLMFRKIGKDKRAKNTALAADRIMLMPLSMPTNLDTPRAMPVAALRAYPNPANSVLYLESDTPATCTIYDMLGTLRLKATVVNGQLPLDRLTPGPYLLRVDDGERHLQTGLSIIR